MDLMVDVLLDVSVVRTEPIVYDVGIVEKILYGDGDLERIVGDALFNSKILVEYAYLIGDNGLVYVSSGVMGIDGVKVFMYSRKCPGCLGLFHTHPIPLPIPTPSDVLNACVRRSSVECIGSLIDYRPVILCMKPTKGWETIAQRINEFVGIIEDYTDAYAPVDTSNGIFMAPYPRPKNAWKILGEFKEYFRSYANISLNVFE